MLAEAFKFLTDLATGARETEVVPLPGTRKYLIVDADGKTTEHEAPPHPRDHFLNGYNDIVGLLTSSRNEIVEPEVFMMHDGLLAALNSGDRRDRVQIALRPTARLELLRAWAGGKNAYAPRDAVKMLQYQLCLTDVDDVTRRLRKLDFAKISGTKVATTGQSESLGRSVEATVVGAEELPTSMIVTIPVWQNPGFDRYQARIDVRIDIDPNAEVVRFIPAPDEVNKAVGRAVLSCVVDLQEALKNVKGALVFNGAANLPAAQNHAF